MKILPPILLLSILFFSEACYSSQLLKISRVELKDIVQLYLTFDVTPQFSTNSDNRRVDLIFSDTTLATQTQIIQADQNIVKILPRNVKDKFILSLFFRYRPQQFKMTKSDAQRLVFEVLLGNEYSRSYQDLANRLKGLTVLDRSSVDFSNPVNVSPYAGDWISFFSQYESPLELTVPVRSTLPPFPIIRYLPPGGVDNLNILPSEIFGLADQELWDQVSSTLLQEINTSHELETLKLLALTFGQALARNDDFDGAFKQLYLLKETYSDELLGTYASYLLSHLRSTHEDPYIAAYEFQSLSSTLEKSSPLAPYLYLAEIETSLITENFDHLNRLLQENRIAMPEAVEQTVQVRHADYWYAIKQPVKALAAYQLLDTSEALTRQPYSLNGFCNTLYEFKKFPQAAECYNKLISLVADKKQLGLVSFRENMSRLKYTDNQDLFDNFAQIENAFTGTEAGLRAAIKRTDLQFIQNRNWGAQAIANYNSIAKDSILRPVREEALFKATLVYAMQGDNSTAIELTQKLLREFQTSSVKISAQALLIERLPSEIKRLVDNEEYIKALVLAKQNRELFQNNWINSAFLVDIANAYRQIGIFDEAQKLYLYLIEIMPVEQREQFYLPMIQSTFEYGNYILVDDYAAQYSYNYPQGKYLDDILLIRIQALAADERINEAIALLPAKLPEKDNFLEVAALLYYRTDMYIECIKALQQLTTITTPRPLQSKLQFMLAESLFNIGEDDKAKAAFSLITDDNPFFENSLFRLAQLERKAGDEKKALSILTKIVEKGKSPRWKQFAERELQFENEATQY